MEGVRRREEILLNSDIVKESLSPSSCSWTRDESKAIPWLLKMMLTLSDCLKLQPTQKEELQSGTEVPMVLPSPQSCDRTLVTWQTFAASLCCIVSGGKASILWFRWDYRGLCLGQPESFWV